MQSGPIELSLAPVGRANMRFVPTKTALSEQVMQLTKTISESVEKVRVSVLGPSHFERKDETEAYEHAGQEHARRG